MLFSLVYVIYDLTMIIRTYGCLKLWLPILGITKYLPMQGRIWIHFLEIICEDIVFKLRRYTHIRINRGRGAITFRGGSKGAKSGHAPKTPENAAQSAYSSI